MIVLTKYDRPDCDGTVMWWEERTKTPWKELWQQNYDNGRRSQGWQKKRWET